MSLRVLHVAQPTTGGVARYVATAAADQRRRGWDAVVACPDGGTLPGTLRHWGVPRLPWPAARSPGPGTVAEIARVRRIVAATRPDVVHLHSAKAGLAGRLAVRDRRPTAFQPHGWSWLAATGAVAEAARRWERVATRWTGALVCVGDGEAAQGRAAGVGAVTVVRNGVDLAEFAPTDDGTTRARIGIAPEVPVAVCPGRLTRQKGQDVLLAAWPAVRARCPDARLVLVGDGELGPALRAARPEGVDLVPAVADVRPWYAAADVVVLPSRWEGLSLTALEAFASGRPVVGSDVPGLAEVLTAGCATGVPPEDPSALAAALADRLADLPGTRAARAAALVHARRFDLRETLDRLAELTERLARPGP
ncbi:Glycosyltransferase involved in cell wall bisynthesis [Amycolatopsis arida]|uniref:Glycosyltransferase involved in cell wall bisynthesis n=1 Tax=Amycolatopsis arida TaxID=587909 RepID=A0A1I5XFH3_9PSEU|nr:glycosyltransferase family 4 protein [Amycolatopsis arida]TDX97499.1 glycosyltransferase involved in cell wall biosynthesis [Amycolatopsis arida]SFQ30407.1 Glycosyltransferase involved in cell wall bisynthesis [Amycolatopsis arida]